MIRSLARVVAAVLLATPALAQVPQSENELLEQEYIQTRVENGPRSPRAWPASTCRRTCLPALM